MAASSEDNSDSSDFSEQDIDTQELPLCKFGIQCYRQNLEHFQKYYHPPRNRKVDLQSEGLPQCKYGIQCYNQNPEHLQQYAHPFTHQEEDLHSKKLPSCKYGMDCYRKNPEHFQHYSHLPDHSKETTHSGELPGCRYGMECHRQNSRHFQRYSHPIDFPGVPSKHIDLSKARFDKYNFDLEAKCIKDEIEINPLLRKNHRKLENWKQCKKELHEISSIRCDTPSYWRPNAFASSYQEISMIEKEREKISKTYRRLELCQKNIENVKDLELRRTDFIFTIMICNINKDIY